MKKITPEHLESLIIGESYYNFPGTTVTVCCLSLENGFNAVGDSACVDPANFDVAIGECIAREKAVDSMWSLEGYNLMQKIYEEGQ